MQKHGTESKWGKGGRRKARNRTRVKETGAAWALGLPRAAGTARRAGHAGLLLESFLITLVYFNDARYRFEMATGKRILTPA